MSGYVQNPRHHIHPLNSNSGGGVGSIQPGLPSETQILEQNQVELIHSWVNLTKV